MSKLDRPALRVIVLTSGFCLGALILKTIWPQMILPKSSLTIYALILILAHISEPVVDSPKSVGFDWLISLTALTVLPACAGVYDGPLWKAILVDAAFSGAVILTLDSIGRRAGIRKTGTRTVWVNGLLLILAVQGFEHFLL